MLRTQYRCHPRIAGISNKLFYEQRLLNGVTEQDRKPLIAGLPTLLFIDMGVGKEQKAVKNNSYSNDAEMSVVLKLLGRLTSCQVAVEDIGVISLYKEQVDRLNEHLNTEQATNKGIQISTVDAFQVSTRREDTVVLSGGGDTDATYLLVM
ncbi:AAA domain-containing protein [Mycotypha africana]|uniref:AAA domain-containing protein n=1 Tax=Mycotypha africana TaxID=64632 RepID=UPI002301E95C|nr:AAA domain-containing protein [Mycotypha africana]KAI8988413.1 AAA domain-containing protein [Mycotypha africana]